MTRATAGLKIVIAAVAAALFMAFGNLSLYLLLPGATGIALVLFGIIIGYRPVAVLGLFVNLCIAALSIEIRTLVSMDVWQTSVLGLLLPTSLLAWSALLSEDTDGYGVRLRTKAFANAFVVATIFALAVPISTVVAGIVRPSAVGTISTMAEISLLFTAIAVTVLLATWSREDVTSSIPPS